MNESGQLALPFRHVPPYGRFLPAGSNAEARAWLARPGDWPEGRLAIWGEAGCGKTHLLRVWAQDRPILQGAELAAFPTGDHAIDDAQVCEPLRLLHWLNTCAEAGHLVVLAGREAPARWQSGLHDLDSRLRAMLAVRIGPPEDSLLDALLQQALTDRQLSVPPTVQAWLRRRLPRTAQAIRDAAELLDIGSLQAHRPITRALAGEILARLRPDARDDEIFPTNFDPHSPGDPGPV
jgi:chromosomal replication initiation ATPase DnaA